MKITKRQLRKIVQESLYPTGTYKPVTVAFSELQAVIANLQDYIQGGGASAEELQAELPLLTGVLELLRAAALDRK